MLQKEVQRSTPTRRTRLRPSLLSMPPRHHHPRPFFPKVRDGSSEPASAQAHSQRLVSRSGQELYCSGSRLGPAGAFGTQLSDPCRSRGCSGWPRVVARPKPARVAGSYLRDHTRARAGSLEQQRGKADGLSGTPLASVGPRNQRPGCCGRACREYRRRPYRARNFRSEAVDGGAAVVGAGLGGSEIPPLSAPAELRRGKLKRRRHSAFPIAVLYFDDWEPRN